MSISTSMTNIEIKNVILPFDFSNSSKNALQHAVTIAKKFHTTVTAVCMMDSYSSNALQLKGIKLEEFEAIAKAKLNELATDIECTVSDGRWSRAVGDIIKKKEGSVVILGVGEKGRDGFFDGPHAYRIVDSINAPLLVIKDSQQNCEYKIIATPLDQTMDTRQKLPFVKLMGGAFTAKVSMIGLHTNVTKDTSIHMESVMRQAAQYIQTKASYEYKIVQSKNEIGDLMNFTDESKADLLVIMSSHEKALSKIFASAYAQQVVEKSNIPVLICPLTVSKIAASVSV